ncbi:Smax1-like [Thalictrum thalictroides]|uniref:Smax1-like n=1 Tax=Thalictrum thalictroides TaxID=46969 RepID=A0A7J6V1V3_THATH|nr:Smax1-like [Thalictrum thalictroides]
MRAGGCTVQQTLTSEAASVLKHSLGLARRRGHAQVTPLHVAATLLSSRASLLRRACLKSHPHSSSHPLQCRALELCFNVALNRLPTTPGPLLHGQPSLSNALIAALKRAQAHQRRGCIEQQQQQPLLTIKVELEQLIISILDDPSVSRVMREAGFSSTSVKNNLEDSSPSSVFQCYSNSNGILPSSCSPSPTDSHRDIINHSSFWQTHFLNYSSDQNPLLFSTPKKHLTSTLFKDSSNDKEEDLRLVVDVLLRKKKRNTVIVGDSMIATESLVTELIAKVERGDVPDELKLVHFIKFQFPPVSLRFMKKEDVEMKIADLRRKIGSLMSEGGAIIYVGDLKWAIEATSSEKDGRLSHGDTPGYSPSEHLVTEIGKLLSDYNTSNSKVWLMATADYQTYMKCQMKQPSLEVQWCLQAVSVPSGGLGLSLHASSGLDSRMTLLQNPPQLLETIMPIAPKEEQDKLNCCPECTSNFEKDAGFLKSGQQRTSSLLLKDMDKSSTNLPYWLQPQKSESYYKDDLAELRRKWNRLCYSLHHSRSNQIHSSSLLSNQSLSNKRCNVPSSYSWWPTSSQYNQNTTFPQSNSISFTESTSRPDRGTVQFGSQQSHPIDFGYGNAIHKDHLKGLSLESLGNKESKDEKITLSLGTSRFPETKIGEMDPRVLSKQLQDNLPWQSEAIPSITDALLKFKSTKTNGIWLLIRGDDWIGKMRLAQVIAESLCGSTNRLVHMNMRRDNHASSCSETLVAVVKKQESCVVLIEEIDYADSHFIELLSDCYNCSNSNEQVKRKTIFIVTKGASSSYEDRNKVYSNVVQMKLHVEDSISSGVLEIDHKRKAEWEISSTVKNKKTCDKKDILSEKVFSRQSSSNTLDLNMLAQEEDNEDDEFKSVPSDLTEETGMDNRTLNRLLESIEHRFHFSRNSTQLSQITENFMAKLNGTYEEVFGKEKKGKFSVDQLVLEVIVNGSGGIVLASFFEKWLKDIFQTSLQMVKKSGNEGCIRLSLGGKENSDGETGYMGSNLPKTIQVTFKK